MTKSAAEGIPQARHPLVTGMAAGLLAGAVTGAADRFLDRFVSPSQKRRDHRLREASAHEMAGPYFARKIFGRKLTEQSRKRARMTFGVVYGLGWGMIYAGLRKKYPQVARWGGIPFAVPFFFACDGTMAPLLGVSPGLRRIPWQSSVKEMGNHLAWTAAAEMVHRATARAEK